ncbi:response regulator [filamentous cyanobacterium LEGE 11480]|uniref:histidine kinase n=1 Tax=Romeriopsis navalis LEGE 11480 TaxID=2777977 RepID=A0A928Z130_9CYAN|nr:ATP-binding protein [Romeriopsis navalis]MBE9028891.1 response regulator [Romeriopsis navalis LEGE 11480]
MQSAAIVIVEDERLVARDLADILIQQGYTVPAICSTAETAIETVSHQPADLVLMDIRLAGPMDGVEAAQVIQAQFGLPIVYLTANADLPTLERVKASRPFGYLLKPFDELMLLTTIDIALSRHQTEQEIRTALQQTERITQQTQAQVASKLEYFAMAAHELRNPLGVIQSVAELLSSPTLNLPAERRARYLQNMQDATGSLDDLLRSILTYSYSSAGKLDSQITKLNLVSFCQEQITLLKVSLGHNHQFTLTTPSNQCIVFLDEQLLWHLLTNLISNAIKYSPIHPDQTGHVNLELSWDAGKINITVRDNGIGIPREATSKIFEPFYRANNTGTIPGTGLGLSLVKQCAERQGGTVILIPPTEQFHGAGFTVTFPRDQRLRLNPADGPPVARPIGQ